MLQSWYFGGFTINMIETAFFEGLFPISCYAESVKCTICFNPHEA